MKKNVQVNGTTKPTSKDRATQCTGTNIYLGMPGMPGTAEIGSVLVLRSYIATFTGRIDYRYLPMAWDVSLVFEFKSSSLLV
jgi:hypothetical protein